MDPEIKKALEELRSAMSKNVEVMARVDAIEKAATGREADTKALRAELDTLKQQATERENTIRELQQRQRTQMLQRDPIRDRREAVRMFGIMARQALANHLRAEIPTQFRSEAEELKGFFERSNRATLQVGSGSGTVFIPTILEADMLIDTLEEVQTTLARTDFLPGMPKAATIPTVTGRPTLQPKRANSDTDMTQSDPTFSEMDVNCQEAYIFFPVDNWLLQLGALNLGNMLLPMLRDSMLDAMDNWLWNADGTAAYNSITGILNDATYASSLPAGKMNFADLTFQDLRQLFSAVLGRGRSRGSFFMSDSILGVCDDIQREGKRPLVVYPGDGATPRMLGKEVVMDEFLPTLADSAAAKAFLAFGDLRTMLVALAGEGIQLAASNEVLFKRNQTAFRGMVMMDIKRKPVNTLRVLKTAAA